MSRRGRPRAATPAQVEQVRSLAAEAVSERRIAEIVFGDSRYRGRVERLLRPRNSPPARELPGEHDLAGDKGTGADEPELPSTRELLNRHRRRLANAGELPSLKEIELLLKLERHVESKETLEPYARSRARSAS
jgi:hypothetical protein